MPFHEEVVDFTKQVAQFLPGYEIMSEHIPSRVVLIAKKKFFKDGKWHTWIDFPKYQELSTLGNDFTTDDYMAETPTEIGLSGKGTLDSMREYAEKKAQAESAQVTSTSASGTILDAPFEDTQETELD